MKSLSIGQQSFADLLTGNHYYVDKTPFIKTVMEHDAQVLFLTRPRRFGKTLFMDTLQCFLEMILKTLGVATPKPSFLGAQDS